MLLDFTSPSGVPLPFADAVRIAMGMEMDEAIDWLCVNVVDAVEVGAEMAILAIFKNDPKKFKVALALGTVLGIVDDNPLLLALNTVIFFKMFRQQNNLWHAWPRKSLLSSALNVFSKAAMSLAVVDIGLGLMGLDLVELLTGLGDAADFSQISDFSEMVGDFVDGIVTFGLISLINRGIRGICDVLTRETRKRLWQKRAAQTALKALKTGLGSNMPLANLTNFVRIAKDSGYYTPQLKEGV
jgi:hypothetical protein